MQSRYLIIDILIIVTNRLLCAEIGPIRMCDQMQTFVTLIRCFPSLCTTQREENVDLEESRQLLISIRDLSIVVFSN